MYVGYNCNILLGNFISGTPRTLGRVKSLYKLCLVDYNLHLPLECFITKPPMPRVFSLLVPHLVLLTYDITVAEYWDNMALLNPGDFHN